MADENVEQTNEELTSQEVVNTNTEQTGIETEKEVSSEVEKKSFIDKMKEKIFGKKEDKPTEDSESTGFEEDISDGFVEVATKAGWSDEKIIDFAEKYSNEQLEELIPFLMNKDEEEEEEEVEEEVDKKDSVVDKLNIEDEKLKAYLKQIEKTIDAKYQEKFGKIENSLKTAEQDRSAQQAQKYQTMADEFFDSASKDFPIFGKTSELVRFPSGTPQAGQVVPKGETFEARNEVWKTAVKFHAMGDDWSDALKGALDWYKGKNMEKDVRGKVLKELKKQETRISPKRSEHKVTSTYASPEEEKKATIADIGRKAGINV